MGILLRELFQYFLPRLIGERMLAGGCIIFIGFWFLDYAIERTRSQPVYSLIMVAVAVAFCAFGIGIVTTPGSIIGAAIIGIGLYVPVFIGRRRRREKTSE